MLTACSDVGDISNGVTNLGVGLVLVILAMVGMLTVALRNRQRVGSLLAKERKVHSLDGNEAVDCNVVASSDDRTVVPAMGPTPVCNETTLPPGINTIDAPPGNTETDAPPEDSETDAPVPPEIILPCESQVKHDEGAAEQSDVTNSAADYREHDKCEL